MENIKKAKHLADMMKLEVLKYQKLYELAKADVVKETKKSIKTHILGHISSAVLAYQKDKNDDNKASWTLAEKEISNIAGKEVKLIQVSNYDFDGYCVVYEFECCGIKFSLYVPNMEKLNVDNYENAHEGMFYLGYYKSECSLDFITMDYNMEKIQEKLRYFLMNVN